jgi:hypothetical protein
VAKPVPAGTSPSIATKAKPEKRTTFEEFVDELRNRAGYGTSKAAVTRAARDVRDKAKFHKVSFSEVDRAIEIILKG